MSNYSHALEAYRDAQEMERWSIIADDDEGREERREIQAEKRLNDSIQDAYERTDNGSRHFEME